ncbi:hypothetical protein [Sphingobacterium paramultivorum]|uniref:hypothetical protein n=1 Tax=Sphingobacterium paramultivorum TaxID=2886510 RepID=UPI00129C5322|nr:hypothetical protein [Sphingobacterium paramultivorum]
MKEIFIKKYWDEEDVLFYLHFQNEEAIAQVEITPKGKVFLSLENPKENTSMLYDQSLDELALEERDFITKEEFYRIWNEQ